MSYNWQGAHGASRRKSVRMGSPKRLGGRVRNPITVVGWRKTSQERHNELSRTNLASSASLRGDSLKQRGLESNPTAVNLRRRKLPLDPCNVGSIRVGGVVVQHDTFGVGEHLSEASVATRRQIEHECHRSGRWRSSYSEQRLGVFQYAAWLSNDCCAMSTASCSRSYELSSDRLRRPTSQTRSRCSNSSGLSNFRHVACPFCR